MRNHHDIDGVSINIGLSDDVILDHSIDHGTHRVKTLGGLTWIVPANDIGSIESCEITGFDDPRIGTDEYLMMTCLRTLRAIPRKYREKYLINTSSLVKSKPDEVYALAREAILQGKAGGRFILSSGCCLGRDTPPEKVDAMASACEDFGAY
ncbi:MAG: uroporphyrinogen decarboxylase family protein [Akkermansiaceae bacterium]|nr:uroporphyrinogen decarboxylase family protein [Akkermansiaceae bacterium]MCF7731033.1 uroporphyrinogen decarboxylase family protein [Akkermansiaceae bacterium]